MLTRDETNQCWDRHRCLKGIPITLKVPTHLKLYVFEKHYLELVKVGTVSEVQPVDLDVVVRDFAHEFISTEKIFTVDFKRPAAGSYNLRLEMDDEQYFAKIQHDVTDQTIEKITGVLSTLLPQFRPTTRSGANGPDVKEVRSLVAVGIFEVDAPDLEDKVAAFLNCHLNQAHDAWIVPPNIKAFERVGIPPDDNLESPYPPQPLCSEHGCPPQVVFDGPDYTIRSQPFNSSDVTVSDHPSPTSARRRLVTAGASRSAARPPRLPSAKLR